MREVKKCRNALNVANFVVTDLRTKNEHLVQQSFRKKFDANSGSSKVVESTNDDTTAMAVPLPTNDFFEVRGDVDGGVEEKKYQPEEEQSQVVDIENQDNKKKRR